MNNKEQSRLLICNELGISPDDLSLEPTEHDLKLHSSNMLKPRTPEITLKRRPSQMSLISNQSIELSFQSWGSKIPTPDPR